MKNAKFAIFSVLALLSVLLIRCMQLLFLIDPDSGFFKDGMESVGTVLAVLTVVIALLTAAFGYFSKQDMNGFMPKGGWLFGGAALLVGLSNIVEPFTTGSVSEGVPAALVLLRTIFIVLAGVAFCYVGLSSIFGAKTRFGVLILPIISWVLRLMVTFISFTGMSNISDNLYDVAMLVTVLLFLLFHAKGLCGIEQKHLSGLILATGILSVLFTAAAVLPRVIVSFSGTPEFLHTPIDSPVTCFLTACYICVYIVQISGKRTARTK